VGVSVKVSRIGAFSPPAAAACEQRDVGLDDRLVEPVLLEKVLVVGMPDKRQMRVQDKGRGNLSSASEGREPMATADARRQQD